MTSAPHSESFACSVDVIARVHCSTIRISLLSRNFEAVYDLDCLCFDRARSYGISLLFSAILLKPLDEGTILYLSVLVVPFARRRSEIISTRCAGFLLKLNVEPLDKDRAIFRESTS